MRVKTMLLKAAACTAALTMAAGMPLTALQPTGAMLTAYALEDAPYTSGETSSLYYVKYDDHAAITGCKTGVTSVEIPDSIEGVPVTCIDDYAFNCSEVTSVTIPETVTKIGNYVFSMSYSLKSVTLPDSLESVGIKAFEDCKSLETVVFPDHLVTFESHAFKGTPWLDAQRAKDPLVIVNGALIDGTTFEGDLVVPSDVKFIASSAFDGNTKLTSAVIPAGVERISDCMFIRCENLTSVEMKGAVIINAMAFYLCPKLTDVKIGSKLKTIEMYAFADCTSQGTITFYGSEETWKQQVAVLDTSDFLKNAKYIFDESHVEDPDPEKIKGDADADGKLSAADLVALQKWLLAVPGAKVKDSDAADMDGNGILDIFDLGLMKRALLKQ